MAESSNRSHFMALIVSRLYYSSIPLDYFFIVSQGMSSGQLYPIRPLCILFFGSGIHPVFRRRSHDHQPQMGEWCVRRGDIRYHSFRIAAHFCINGFPFPGDGDNAIAPAGLLRTDGGVSLSVCLSTELHLYGTSRLGDG